MNLYQGVAHWPSHRAGESLVMMFPEGIEAGKPVITQWHGHADSHEPADPARKLAGRIVSTEIAAAGPWFRIEHDDTCSFDVVIGEHGARLSVAVNDPGHPTPPTFTLRIHYPDLPVTKGFASTTTTVYNDVTANGGTAAVYNCTLSDSSDNVELRDTFLSALGEIYGVVGLIVSKTGIVEEAGIALAAASLVQSKVLSWIYGDTTQGRVQDILGYGGSITRTSRTGFFPTNTLTITAVTIVRNGRGEPEQLVIRQAVKDQLGDGITKLSTLKDLVDNGEPILQLTLDDGSWTFESKALLYFKGWKIREPGRLTKFESGVNMVRWPTGRLINIVPGASPPNGHWDHALSLIKGLDHDETATFGYIYSLDAGRDARFGILDVFTEPTRHFGKFGGFGATGEIDETVLLGTAANEDDVRAQIKRYLESYPDKTFPGFTWRGTGGGPVHPYRSISGMTPVRDPQQFVFLPAGSLFPYQRLVRK